MNQDHRAVLERSFAFKETNAWIALISSDDAVRHFSPIGRFGKVQDGVLYFTLGETKAGKACRPIALTERLRSVLLKHGLRPVTSRSTDTSQGTSRAKGKYFVGFKLHEVDVSTVRAVIAHAFDEVRGCAHGDGPSRTVDLGKAPKPSMTVLSDAEEIAAANEMLLRRLAGGPTESRHSQIGYRGGREEGVIYWRPDLQFWFCFEPYPNRFWNAFGTDYPFDGSFSIVIEINPPFEGIDRRMGGAFARDEDGALYLLHRGKVGGGRKGISKKSFFSYYRSIGAITTVRDGDRDTEVIVIAAVDDVLLPASVAHFVRTVEEYKNHVTGDDDEEPVNHTTGKPRLPSTTSFSPEYQGTRTYTTKEQIEAECRHGIVVNNLRHLLERQGLDTHNDQQRDLCITDGGGRTRVIFEAKTRIDTQSLYTAVGQLVWHATDDVRLRVAVLPDEVGPDVRARLRSLDITVITYEWSDQQPVFHGIEKVVARL